MFRLGCASGPVFDLESKSCQGSVLYVLSENLFLVYQKLSGGTENNEKAPQGVPQSEIAAVLRQQEEEY